MSKFVILSNDLDIISGASSDFGATVWHQLNIVNKSADRNGTERQTIAGSDVGFLPCHNHIADFHALRKKYITPFTVSVANKTYEAGAVRIILDSFYFGRNFFFIVNKINLPEHSFVSAALIIHCRPSAAVAPGFPVHTASQ